MSATIRIMFFVLPKRSISLLLPIFIFTLALGYRIYGISANHSFWIDESQISYAAEALVQGAKSLTDVYKHVPYQYGQMLITAMSYFLLGIGEWQSRLPTVIWGAIGVVMCLLLVRQYSKNPLIGFITVILQTCSTMLLSQSTQLKPYTTIATITLVLLYLMKRNIETKKTGVVTSLYLFPLVLLAGFLHYIGFLLIFPLASYFALVSPTRIVRILATISIVGLVFGLSVYIPGYFNHFVYFKNLLLRQYGVITGFFALWIIIRTIKKDHFALVVGSLVVSWVMMYIFKHYTHNIRYVITPMTAMMTFAPLGIYELTQLITKKWRFVSQVVLIIAMLVLMRDKISWLPQTYYSPNKDFYGDVQIADYKTFAAKIIGLHPDITHSVVIAPISFYGHAYLDYKIDLYLTRSNRLVEPDVAGVRRVSQLGQMEAFMHDHPQGYLIVEKWHSFVPDDVQEYAAQHMEKLIEVDSLPQTPDDPWPLILYRWGYNSERSPSL